MDCIVESCTFKNLSGECTSDNPNICPHYTPFEVLGDARAMKGDELIINLGKYGLATITIKDKKKRWELYCKPVKITISEVSKEELLKFHDVKE